MVTGITEKRAKNIGMWEIKKIVGCGIFNVLLVFLVLMNNFYNYKLIVILCKCQWSSLEAYQQYIRAVHQTVQTIPLSVDTNTYYYSFIP